MDLTTWTANTFPLDLQESNANTQANSSMNSSLQCTEMAQFQHHLLPIVYSIVFVFSLIENMTALYILNKQWKRSPHFTAFTLSIIIIDILFAFSLPFMISYHHRGNDWMFGDFLCKVAGCLFFCNMYSCTIFLFCICIDRYIAVMHPIKYLQLQNSFYRTFTSFTIWMVIVLAAVTFILLGSKTRKFSNGKLACMENFSHDFWTKRLAAFSTMSTVLGFVTPFLTILVCYSIIARRIIDMTQKKKGSQYLKKKSLCTIAGVVMVLTICFLPFHVVQIVHILLRTNVLPYPGLLNFTCVAKPVATVMASLNCCLDPFVYYFSIDNFDFLPACFARRPQRIIQKESCS
ncbi:lysophosphatidic acid receptor 6-like [Erpetoichthys calabaricus]|uniref:lysophosphatidic acid receptor 6-like n=1 Tax=Erpetoichthys calabaricus TaxID=27687 RepID=UPI00109FC7A2|nr:lysophosphatidic acid receptor 6-like [Erpetoichthys calabaricus]